MITQTLSVLIVTLTALGVIGCAGGSGIVQISDDTYMHLKLGGVFTVSGSEVKAELYKEANEFCAAKTKKMEPLTSTHVDNIGNNYASAENQFNCREWTRRTQA